MLVIFIIVIVLPFVADAIAYNNVISFYRKNKGAPTKEGMLDTTLTLFAEYGICPGIKSHGKYNEPFGAYSISDDIIYANPTVKKGETLLDRFIFFHEVGHCVQVKEKDPHMMLYKSTVGIRTSFSFLFVITLAVFIFTGNTLSMFGAVLFLVLYTILSVNDVMCEKNASQFAIDILSKEATKKEKLALNKFMRLCYTTYTITAITGIVKSAFSLLIRRPDGI